jgi:hypothetical protein
VHSGEQYVAITFECCIYPLCPKQAAAAAAAAAALATWAAM